MTKIEISKAFKAQKSNSRALVENNVNKKVIPKPRVHSAKYGKSFLEVAGQF